jgi:hypothetical protein
MEALPPSSSLAGHRGNQSSDTLSLCVGMLIVKVFCRCLLVATYVMNSQPKFVWVAPME